MASRDEVLAEVLVLPGFRDLARRPLANLGTFARRKPVAALCAVFLVTIIAIAIGADIFATHDPIAQDTVNRLHGPSLSALLGTDHFGRDVWSQLVHGARVSLTIGFAATGLSLVIGTAIALISGYFGGRVDLIIQRFVDGFQAMPGLLVVLTVVSLFELNSVREAVIVLSLVLGVLFGIGESRVIRSNVLGIKGMPYVEAARTIGASPVRVILRHVLPNIMAIVIIVGSVAIAQVILIEATLGFLGFGVPPPQPTWGQMLSGPARQFMTQAPWMGIAPGVAISLTVLAFNLLGDALRDVLDPKLRGA